MTTITTIALITIAILALTILWAIGSYNRFVQLKALLNEAWSGIDVQLKRRYDLIPQLVTVVKGYSIHEKSIFEELGRMRAAAIGASNVEQKSVAEAGLSQTLKTLFAVAENYPELKANENFLMLQKEMSLIEQELQMARRYYNGTARNYNVATVQFPSTIIARTFGFQPAAYFELNASEERNVPPVQF